MVGAMLSYSLLSVKFGSEMSLQLCDGSNLSLKNIWFCCKVAFYPQGVVELYSKIADQGYTIMFLTNR